MREYSSSFGKNISQCLENRVSVDNTTHNIFCTANNNVYMRHFISIVMVDDGYNAHIELELIATSVLILKLVHIQIRPLVMIRICCRILLGISKKKKTNMHCMLAKAWYMTCSLWRGFLSKIQLQQSFHIHLIIMTPILVVQALSLSFSYHFKSMERAISASQT